MSGIAMILHYQNDEFLGLGDFIKGCRDGIATEKEVPDAFTEFFEKAEIAASSGLGSSASQHVENFFTETSQQSESLAEHYRKLATKQNPPAAGAELAKAFRSDNRRVSLRAFLKSSVAQGETIEAVIAFAQRSDPATAALLREIAAEF